MKATKAASLLLDPTEDVQSIRRRGNDSFLGALLNPAVLTGLAAAIPLGAILSKKLSKKAVSSVRDAAISHALLGGGSMQAAPKRDALMRSIKVLEPSTVESTIKSGGSLYGTHDMERVYKMNKISNASSVIRTDVSGGQMDVLHTRDIPIYDWDLGPNESLRRGIAPSGMAHPNMSPEESVSGLGEILDIARKRESSLKQKGVNTAMSIYMTPGGYRGVEVGFNARPSVGLSPAMAPEKVDPWYQFHSMRPSVLVGEQQSPLGVMAPSYAARVSPKPTRPAGTDFVAGYIGGIGGGKPLQSSVMDVSAGHARPISESLGAEEMRAFIDAVGREIGDLSPRDRDAVAFAIAKRYGIPVSAIGSALMMAKGQGQGPGE